MLTMAAADSEPCRAVAGKIQATVTMIYPARSEPEVDVVLDIAAASRNYAQQPVRE